MHKSLTLILLATILMSGRALGDAIPDRLQQSNVIEQIEIFLREQASSYPGSVDLSIDAERIQKLPDCDQFQVFLSSGQNLRSRLSVGVRCVAPQQWVGYAQANLSIQGFYYVPTHNLKPGLTLSLDDLAAREGDLLRLAPGIVADPSRIIGYVTTQNIQAGSPIKSRALRDPESILKGQAVRLQARGIGFLATTEGRAMQSGAPGAQVKVRTDSGRIVSGTILNANTVQVVM